MAFTREAGGGEGFLNILPTALIVLSRYIMGIGYTCNTNDLSQEILAIAKMIPKIIEIITFFKTRIMDEDTLYVSPCLSCLYYLSLYFSLVSILSFFSSSFVVALLPHLYFFLIVLVSLIMVWQHFAFWAGLPPVMSEKASRNQKHLCFLPLLTS